MKKKYYSLPEIKAYNISYVRRGLGRLIKEENKDNEVVYMDTDGIYIKVEEGSINEEEVL